MTINNRSIVAGIFSDEKQAQQAMADLQSAGFTDNQIRYSVHKGGAGILESLTGMGFTQEEAEYYNSEFLAGRTVVTVKDQARQPEAAAILQRNGAYDASRPMSQTSGATEGEGAQKIQLKEERLQATTTSTQVGEVGLHKEVVSEQKSIDVPVSHEEVYIERRASDGQVSDTPIGEGQAIRVPVSAEQVNVSKQTVQTGEVSIGKRQVQETQQVTDTVRHEEARVERQGDVTIEGDETGAQEK
ncbi:MAG TPA: YsnF/AvaK domain-containing protein [Ktedonobacteraceae bacterium]